MADAMTWDIPEVATAKKIQTNPVRSFMTGPTSRTTPNKTK